MNLTSGFPCPTCGHREANLLNIEKENGAPVSFRLHCTKCETVFREMREPAPESDPVWARR